MLHSGEPLSVRQSVQVLPAEPREGREKRRGKSRAESDTLAGLGVCQSVECARERVERKPAAIRARTLVSWKDGQNVVFFF